MRNRVLFIRAGLGKRLVEIVRIEQRVIAKAALAALFQQHLALAIAAR